MQNGTTTVPVTCHLGPRAPVLASREETTSARGDSLLQDPEATGPRRH